MGDAAQSKKSSNQGTTVNHRHKHGIAFDVKTAIKQALLENAEGVILTHNHPSGGTKPSSQDDKITQELKKACDI